MATKSDEEPTENNSPRQAGTNDQVPGELAAHDALANRVLPMAWDAEATTAKNEAWAVLAKAATLEEVAAHASARAE